MDIFILGVLKVAGLVVGLASTLWGMKHEMKVDDGQGGKRLTPQGHRAIALALGGFLIAASSQGFETIARQAEARNKAITDEAKAAQDFRNEQRAKRTLDLQILSRAEAVSQRAEERAARAEQRLLVLRASNEQRERTLALSRQVNEGSQRNLERAEVALTQLGRLLQPLSTIRFSVTWEVPLGTQMPDFADLAGRARGDPTLVDGLGPVYAEDELISFEVDYRYGPELYPRRVHNFEVYEVVVAGITNVSLFANNAAPEYRAEDDGLRDRGDLRFRVQNRPLDRDGRPEAPVIRYDVRSNSLVVQAETTDAQVTFRSSNLVSIPDLENSLVGVEIDDTRLVGEPYNRELLLLLRRNARPVRMELSTAGHTYYAFDPTEFRRIPRGSGSPTFVARLRRRAF